MKKTIQVQRSPTEMLIDALEYESRRFESKVDRAIDDASRRFYDLVSNLVSLFFSEFRRR